MTATAAMAVRPCSAGRSPAREADAAARRWYWRSAIAATVAVEGQWRQRQAAGNGGGRGDGEVGSQPGGGGVRPLAARSVDARKGWLASNGTFAAEAAFAVEQAEAGRRQPRRKRAIAAANGVIGLGRGRGRRPRMALVVISRGKYGKRPDRLSRRQSSWDQTDQAGSAAAALEVAFRLCTRNAAPMISSTKSISRSPARNGWLACTGSYGDLRWPSRSITIIRAFALSTTDVAIGKARAGGPADHLDARVPPGQP